jgi:hypothetical protein
MPATTWTWRFLDHDGAVLGQPPSEAFASRADAESWIGENWPRLADDGVAAAQLLGAGSPVGRPLPLR